MRVWVCLLGGGGGGFRGNSDIWDATWQGGLGVCWRNSQTPIIDCFFFGWGGGGKLRNSDNPEGIWLMGGGKLRELRLNLG